MIRLHTQFGVIIFFRRLTLFVSIRGKIFLIVITPIGGLQDVSGIMSWDRGVVIRLIIRKLLDLNGGAPFCFLGGFRRLRCDVDIIITPIGSLQDVSWIARWDKGVVIRLVLNLLNLDRWALSSWCWCWFSGWFCSCVPRGPSQR